MKGAAGQSRWVKGLVGAAAITLSIIWAFAPLDTPELEPPPTPSSKPIDPRAILPELDLAAFRAPLWVAPPEPPAPPAPPAPALPPPPLRLQLLAIIHEDGRYQALLYDQDADRLRVLAEGEGIGTGTIERISADEVLVRDGAGTQTLALNKEAR